jgi:hypothetical protein
MAQPFVRRCVGERYLIKVYRKRFTDCMFEAIQFHPYNAGATRGFDPIPPVPR